MKPGFSSARTEAQSWILCFGLVLPAAWPYLTHYFVGVADLVPTGFVHYDMASYMANAREYVDATKFQLAYSNPFSYSYSSPHIYFQPLTLLLGIVWRMTGWSPGVVLMIVGSIAALSCARVSLALYRQLVGWEAWPQWLGFGIFLWGGGVLALAGIVYKFILGHQVSIFFFDPGDGGWGLNLGRNLRYPTEALYHALFLAAVLFVVKGRFRLAALLAFLSSISHPFTGIELLLILLCWAFFEWYFMESRTVPGSFVLTIGILFSLHVGYYLVFLMRFPEHRKLVEQWTIPWLLQAQNFVPAYFLAAAIAIWPIRRFALAREFFGRPHNRLLAIWALVAFALANHEFAIRPVQPLHFDRGYIWIPLFLMGAPSLVSLFSTCWSRLPRAVGILCLSAVVFVFWSDNAAWLASFAIRKDQGIRLRADEVQIIEWFNANENKGSVVISQDLDIAYMAIVYSPLRAWASHVYNTPDRALRESELNAFFRDGQFLDRWRTMPALVVFAKGSPVQMANLPAELQGPVFQNGSYTVFRVLAK